MTAPRKPKRRPSGPSGANLQPGYLLRYEPEQRERWEAAAKRDGRSLADWARRALDKAAG